MLTRLYWLVERPSAFGRGRNFLRGPSPVTNGGGLIASHGAHRQTAPCFATGLGFGQPGGYDGIEQRQLQRSVCAPQMTQSETWKATAMPAVSASTALARWHALNGHMHSALR
jgi:hypothetical protein